MSSVRPVLVALVLAFSQDPAWADSPALLLNLIPAKDLNEKAPDGGDFDSALAFETKFSTEESDDGFAGKSFAPTASNWSDARSVAMWIYVTGNTAILDAKLRVFSGPQWVDLPFNVPGNQFGQWVRVEIPLGDIDEAGKLVLMHVDNAYVFTSKAWIGDFSDLHIFISEIALE